MSSVEFRRVNTPWPNHRKAHRIRPPWEILLLLAGAAIGFLSPMFVLRFGYWMGWWGL